jgi:hypothetical protein
MSLPSVCFGATPVRNETGAVACWPSPPFCGLARPVISTMCSRSGSSGLLIGMNSKPVPAVLGIHWSMM